jgi:hypothetical protein
VPFDVRNRLEAIHQRRAAAAAQEQQAGPADQEARGPATMPEPSATEPGQAQEPASERDGRQDEAADAVHMAKPEVAVSDATAADAGRSAGGDQYDRPSPPPGVRPIGTLTRPGRAMVEGRVYAVEIRPVERNTVLAAEVADSTGQLTALFYGRSHIPGLECGSRVRFRGQVGMRAGGPVMINPAYELVAPGDAQPEQAGNAGGGEDAAGDSPKRRGPRRRKGP